MKYLLPFLLLLVTSVSLADSGAYRVEVIVFQHLQVESQSTRVQALRSFSRFPDLEDTNLPDDLHTTGQKSTRMDGVWRRLNSSTDYQPLNFTEWQQNRIDYYPPVRVHDQQIIATQLRPPTAVIVAELADEDPLAAYRSTFFQLDGSVQLRRSRFLHLFLDLEYRLNYPQNETEPGFVDGDDLQTELEGGVEDSTGFEVFVLKQNRQIRTGRMHYFDTPFLGALVYVSAIE